MHLSRLKLPCIKSVVELIECVIVRNRWVRQPGMLGGNGLNIDNRIQVNAAWMLYLPTPVPTWHMPPNCNGSRRGKGQKTPRGAAHPTLKT